MYTDSQLAELEDTVVYVDSQLALVDDTVLYTESQLAELEETVLYTLSQLALLEDTVVYVDSQLAELLETVEFTEFAVFVIVVIFGLSTITSEYIPYNADSFPLILNPCISILRKLGTVSYSINTISPVPCWLIFNAGKEISVFVILKELDECNIVSIWVISPNADKFPYIKQFPLTVKLFVNNISVDKLCDDKVFDVIFCAVKLTEDKLSVNICLADNIIVDISFVDIF